MISVDQYRAFPIVEATSRVRYGDDASQFYDLFFPSTVPHENLPLLILIHGGCWRAAFGLGQLGQMAAALAEQGVLVANLEYRRIGNGGGWPATFEDVACAVDHLFGSVDPKRPFFDPQRIVVAGHSAGGHLALWLACRPQFKPNMVGYADHPCPIKTAVSLAGIPHMANAQQTNICRGAVAELLGGTPTEQTAVYHAASPHSYLPLGIPHIHINGTEDSIVPLNYVRQFVQTAQAANDPATLIELPNSGHFEIVTAADHPAWHTVQQTILNQLQPTS